MKPNWLNAGDYPQADELSPRAWAWEFLRRNRGYVADWAEFQSLIGEYAGRYPSLTKLEMARLMIDTRYQHVVETGSLAKGNYSKSEISLVNWYGRKWGMGQIADPEASYEDRTHRWIDTAGKLVFPLEGFDYDDPQFMAVAIDLTLPLKDQLKQVSDHYKIRRKTQIKAGRIQPATEMRKRFSDYPRYLRVLDATEAGADRAEIAKVLLPKIDNSAPDYPGSKNIDNWLVAAEKLSTEGYRALPLMPEK